jgi:hypothetical protein
MRREIYEGRYATGRFVGGVNCMTVAMRQEGVLAGRPAAGGPVGRSEDGSACVCHSLPRSPGEGKGRGHP